MTIAPGPPGPPARRIRGPQLVGLLIVALGVLAVVGLGDLGRRPTVTPRPLPSPTGTLVAQASSAPTLSPTPSPAAPSATPGGSFVPGAVAVGLRTVVSGLDQPVFVTSAGDGSGRLFVVEQTGRIRIVRDGRLLATPFLDIHDRVSCCDERGLLGLAFAPGYGRTGSTFVIDYTDRDGNTVIATGTPGADPDRVDPGSIVPILHIDQPFANHNGGMVAFGPDGYVYIGMGDGGSAGDPAGNGQRLDTLLGKILRIDPLHPSATVAYSVPDSNPFVGVSGARPEIWTYGMRNPWRFSFDRATGDLWIGDVGQDAYEEVDRARAADGGGRGLDYGWNRMEGLHCYPATAGCDRAGLALPIVEVAHGSGDCALIGGYVYRGPAYPHLDGAYVFGDECTGTIKAVTADAATGAGPAGLTPVILLESHRPISSFGEDEAGELYLTDLGSGELLQVIDQNP